MALRKQTNPREMDLQPEMREILMRNGMQAHIIAKGDGYQLAVQGHDSPLLTYNLSRKQMLALTDWGTNTANRKAWNVFTSIVGNDFYMPRNLVHARNAGGRVAMGLHGYRVGAGEYGRHAGMGRGPGLWGPGILGWTPRQQDGMHLRRVGGQLFYQDPVMVAERPDGRMKPGELQSGAYGFYYKNNGQQAQSQETDVLQELQSVITPIQQRPRSNGPATPYKELITSPVYFSGEKWQECLSSHGIIIDEHTKTLILQSDKTAVDMVYDLTDEELKELTSNSIKEVPVETRLATLNNIIKDDFKDKVTMSDLNSSERIQIGLNPEVEQEMLQKEQSRQDEYLSAQLRERIAPQEERTQEITPDDAATATVDGNDLQAIREDKGWYREGAHGREVQVDNISVSPSQTEGRYMMTAVINGQPVTHEISQKQYDKFLALDDYHRMKLFDSIFDEVGMKNRPGAGARLGSQILGALTAGVVVAGEIGHGFGHHHDDGHFLHEDSPHVRVYGKAGVDSPNDIAARNFEAMANQVANDMRKGRGI